MKYLIVIFISLISCNDSYRNDSGVYKKEIKEQGTSGGIQGHYERKSKIDSLMYGNDYYGGPYMDSATVIDSL